MSCSNIVSNKSNLLEQLYTVTGNCSISGYLDSISSLYTENNQLYFNSCVNTDQSSIDSTGVVLSKSVLIKQTEKINDRVHYYLFSWNMDSLQYSYILFGDKKLADDCFDIFRSKDLCICDVDLEQFFKQNKFPFEEVYQVLVNQSFSSSTMNSSIICSFQEKTNFSF